MNLSQRVAERYRQGVIRKEKDEWCVRSPDNPDWNGGCFSTKEKAKKRLKQVEHFKRNKSAASLNRMGNMWLRTKIVAQ